jgi:hypothetical protein
VKVAVRKQKAEREDDGKGKRKGMVTFAAIGSVAVLLIAGGLGYARFRPGKVVPKPTAVAQPATTNVVLPTPTNLPVATSAAVPTGPTPDQKLRSRSDVMNNQLNAPSRISNDLKMLAGKEPPPSSGFGTGT